jgi:para-nitrobenzyl esterase
MKRCALLSSLLLLAGLSSHAETAAPQVKVAQGTLEGTRNTDLYMFKGVPFAAPPVGTLRWRPPQPATPWKGVRDADAFAARCMQRPVFSDMKFRSNGVSEDCLYLNVWTSTLDASARQPVLVYFYGGGFIAGDGSEFRYDGASMARRGITTVTVNYRLDVFGMFAHPELTRESPDHASGNYTLLDQAAALKWVRANIAAFGGDPDRITIAGESAGSMSVSSLMASPLSKELIAGAIGESGSTLFHLMPLSHGEQSGVAFMKAAGATSLAQLRRMPADQLLELAGREGMPRMSIIQDGLFFTEQPTEAFAQGRQAHVPLLAGSNSQENSYGALLKQEPPTPANYARALQTRFGGANAARLMKLYPGNTEAEVMSSGTALAGDMFLGYVTWKWVDLHTTTGGAPTYYYYYSHPRPVTVAEPDKPAEPGAVHSAEIEYAMGNLATNKVFAWTPEDYRVSAVMQEYFANFIRHGNPNDEHLPDWGAYGDAHHPRMTIDVESKLAPDAHRERYELLKEIIDGAGPRG